jgi:Ca2+-binding RTX toxin-like protein
MDWTYRSAPDGNVVQTGETALTGLRGNRKMRLALGFGEACGEASAVARRSLRGGDRRGGVRRLSTRLHDQRDSAGGPPARNDGDDVICAGDGDDRVEARGGDDAVFGDGGDDRIEGDSGDDTLYGSDGHDRLDGGSGWDVISE